MKKVLLFFCLIPFVMSNMLFTEIMYNPSGVETKKEWVELFNNGTNSINMTNWKINDGILRNLNLYQGTPVIPPYGFAILARDGQNFSSEYNYNGTIFQSTFSLSNTGKTLLLIDNYGNIIDNLTYSNIANEDYTIELNENGWQSGQYKGTPGYLPFLTNPNNPDNANDESNNNTESIINNTQENTQIDINQTQIDTNNNGINQDTNNNGTNQDTNNNETNHLENPDNNQSPNQVPEFNLMGVILMILGIIFIIKRERLKKRKVEKKR